MLRVRAERPVLGLAAGQETSLADSPLVQGAIRSGYLVVEGAGSAPAVQDSPDNDGGQDDGRDAEGEAEAFTALGAGATAGGAGLRRRRLGERHGQRPDHDQ